jgi:hypothetical protein
MMVLLRQWVAVPAFVIERLGILGSLRRSKELTKGRRGRIFRIYVLALIAGSFLSWIVGDFIATSITTAFSAVLVSVVYHRLRAEKEGVTMASIDEELDRSEAVLVPPSHERSSGRAAAARTAAAPHPLRQRAQSVVRTGRD